MGLPSSPVRNPVDPRFEQSHRVASLRDNSALWPAIAIACALIGTVLRLAHPALALPWYDEFRTLLHASGHSYDDLERLVAGAQEISAGTLMQKYLAPQPTRGVLASLAVALRVDPQVSPLYYGLVRLAFRAGSSPLASARQVSAVWAVLLVPAFYWLARELLPTRRSMWLALAIVSLSPAQVYWAFEARPYSLWGATLACSTAALLYALRKPGRLPWLLYVGSLGLMLWAHLFSQAVVVVHLMFVWRERPERLKEFCTALLAGELLALPWSWVCIKAWSATAAPQVSWLSRARGPNYVGHLSYAIGHGNWFPFRDGIVALGFGLMIDVLVLGNLVRNNRGPARFVILLLFSATLLPLATMDVLFGGIRLSVVRYLFPSSLALLLACAVYLGQNDTWRRQAGALLLLALECWGSVQTANSPRPEGKWRTEPTTVPAIAAAVAHFSSPVIVSLGQVSLPATLALVVAPDTRFAFFKSEADFSRLRDLGSGHTVLLLAGNYPWYYEPWQAQADDLARKLGSRMRLMPVAPGLFLVDSKSAPN